MQRPPTKMQFEDILATHVVTQNIKCLQINSVSNTQPLTICSYTNHPAHAIVVACPEGGATFNIAKGWYQESATTHVKTENERHDVVKTFHLSAKNMDLNCGTISLIADRIRLQSSVHPFDIHSFSSHKNGLAIRCPKGGVAISSGAGGITHTTAGNVEYQLDADNSHVRIASRGTKKHTIVLGNSHSETIVENQLTVRGKLVLSDESVIEKHVSVVHELQNVVELACQTASSTATFDYGLVATQRDGKSGIIFDHVRNLFYFSTQLGTYQQNRFALPKEYADVQGRALIAQQKMKSPFVEAHSVQCRSIRCGKENLLTLQSPVVQCSQRLVCSSVESELSNTVRATTTTTTTQELDVAKRAKIGHTHTNRLTICDTLFVDRWFFNTVGPNGRHRTLQDFLDAADEIRASGSGSSSSSSSSDTDPRTPVALSTDHVVMETCNTGHNCNAIVDRPTCRIDGRHSLLTGVIEITDVCDTFLIVDARVSQFTLTSSAEEPARVVARPSVFTLRNVHGHVKDWYFDMPQTTLRIENCHLEFQNQMLGSLKDVVLVHSVIEGNPGEMVCPPRLTPTPTPTQKGLTKKWSP
jgi:hypothetical protein